MIPHTKAFKRLKDEAQRVFDFAILVCYAVPNLKLTLDKLTAGQPLPFTPDHFDSRPIPTEEVRQHARGYKEVLSRFIFLSSFSYFEAYFVDLIKEIIEFHGREAILHKHDLSRNRKILSSNLQKAKRKLQEYPQAKNRDRYRSYRKRLAAEGFVFPSLVLARRGLQQLFDLADTDYVKANEIPGLIESLFQLPLDPIKETKRFHDYRDMRNKIAHGRPDAASLHLKKAIEANDFLRNLALKIDKHVIENLLLVEL